MLLLERAFQIPGTARKKAYLLDKKLPQEAVEKLIARAMEERKMGLQVNLAVMKKIKSFRKSSWKQRAMQKSRKFTPTGADRRQEMEE